MEELEQIFTAEGSTPEEIDAAKKEAQSALAGVLLLATVLLRVFAAMAPSGMTFLNLHWLNDASRDYDGYCFIDSGNRSHPGRSDDYVASGLIR